MGGQGWSLLTMFRDGYGMTPRRENIPLTIDAQYVAGYTWTRNWQLRAVKQLTDGLWAGVSVESPQAAIAGSPTASCVNCSTTIAAAGNGGTLTATGTYSEDFMPDVVGKVVWEPGWGHYEAYVIGRGFRSRASGMNDITLGGGVGAGMILPVMPKMLDFQADFLAGEGIGRYGSAQLPDVAVRPFGQLTAIPEAQILVGFIGHPTPAWDVYLYGGLEAADKTAFTFAGTPTTGYGYGSGLYNDQGCNTEGAPSATTCSGNTREIGQISGGVWYRPYKGDYGTVQLGAQVSYTERYTFKGLGGVSPSTNELIFMTSFRYYPFSS